uniref:Uncharacterized protein n=1 Tax=Rhizophagus irregularis (strain DAOM 181602 / DAOM 197198 / MUCL 43194) TaxID=747089 RepID=U9T4E8_RHIID
MDVTIIDSIIQEQTNIDYNERMRENNYEVVKVHLTDVISKIGLDQILEIWLLPIPQSPIANEAVVHEISRQLGNWNVETSQNGIVITSQGGYDFSLLTFLGQPFTPIFVAEVVNVSKEAIFNEVDIRFKNEMYEKDDDDENITHQKCKWEDLDSDNILPDFTLDIEFVEKIILQKYEDDELLIEEVKENEDKGEKPMKKI